MPRVELHTPESTVGRAHDVLTDLWERHGGQVGPMTRAMGGSPSVLTGYLDLSRAMRRTKLRRPITERISLAVQEQLGCATCLAAHTAAAREVGVSEQEIALARQGTSSDPAVAAIVGFARQVHTDPAGIDDDAVAALRSHGYRERDVLDVVGLVALNVLTGTFNLVAGIEPDEPARLAASLAS
ncbi:MAG: carboxymuconolactone decarboxylase family protein [Acidimicrobiales bacterium]|nr:carboxymuconolactone decarboxylase family protein [Acidimicrobiales bacterium]